MTTKTNIVAIILDSPKDAPVRYAAEARFGSSAFDSGFENILERILQDWYKEYTDDMELEEDWLHGFYGYMSSEGDL